MTNKKISRKAKARAKRKARELISIRRSVKNQEKRDVLNQQAQQRMPTVDAKLINNLMIEKRIKGDFKDYVIIVGDRLIDWKKQFNIKLDEDKTLGVDGVALVHKRKLHMLIGDEEASRFWHPRLGRIMDVPEGTKPNKKEDEC